MLTFRPLLPLSFSPRSLFARVVEKVAPSAKRKIHSLFDTVLFCSSIQMGRNYIQLSPKVKQKLTSARG